MSFDSGALSRYEFIERVGSGGFSETWRARARETGADRIIKLLPRDRIPESAFRAEVASLSSVDIDGIPKLYEWGETVDRFFLVMELIDGTPLHELRMEWTEEEIRALLYRIATILHEMHRRGIWHLDVKHANILRRLRSSGASRYVLVDFGSAVRFTGETTRFLTLTPRFAAFEALQGMPSARSDIYSLGLVAACLMTGLSVDEMADDVYRVHRSFDSWTLFLDTLRPGMYTNGLQAVITKMIKISERERFSDMGEALRALEHLEWSRSQPTKVHGTLSERVEASDPTLPAPAARTASPGGIARIGSFVSRVLGLFDKTPHPFDRRFSPGSVVKLHSSRSAIVMCGSAGDGQMTRLSVLARNGEVLVRRTYHMPFVGVTLELTGTVLVAGEPFDEIALDELPEGTFLEPEGVPFSEMTELMVAGSYSLRRVKREGATLARIESSHGPSKELVVGSNALADSSGFLVYHSQTLYRHLHWVDLTRDGVARELRFKGVPNDVDRWYYEERLTHFAALGTSAIVGIQSTMDGGVTVDPYVGFDLVAFDRARGATFPLLHGGDCLRPKDRINIEMKVVPRAIHLISETEVLAIFNGITRVWHLRF